MLATLAHVRPRVACRLSRYSENTGAWRGRHSVACGFMFPPYIALSLLLAPAGSPPDTWQGHEAECGRLEDQAKLASSADRGAAYFAAADECGRAFEKVPDGHKAMDQRSYFVVEAHRLYQQAHDAGVTAALCSDIRMLDDFAAQLAALRPGDRAQDRTDVARMREENIAQRAAPCVGPEPAAPDPVATVATNPTVVAPPPASIPSGPVEAAPAPWRARPLRLTGGAALGLGLGLGVGVIAALVRGAALHGQAASMTYDGQLIPETDAGRFAELDARGHRADNAAIGLGVAGGLLTVAGVALLIVDARRHAAPRRAAVHPSVRPTAAGIHLSLRF